MSYSQLSLLRNESLKVHPMPKAEPHFDAEALIAAVQAQDIGLRITTNNPAQFKQIIYKAARKLNTKIHIYADPKSRNAFLLLKDEVPA